MPVTADPTIPVRAPRPTVRETKPVPTRAAERPVLASIRRILCPVDFSSASRPAIELATLLARGSHADITGLFVCTVPRFARGGVDPEEGTPESTLGVARAVAEDLTQLLRPAWETGIFVRQSVPHGDAVDQILAEASAMPADVIVMGTHGRSGVERWLGSVTQQVLRRAPCPVLTVSPFTETLPRGGVRRILCAVDLTAGSERTLEAALSLARATGAAVTVVHAREGAMAAPAPARLAAIARDQLHERIAPYGTRGIPVEEIVVPGGARHQILRLARERGADVIVLGTHGRGVAGRLLLGSTAEHVVRKSPIPVLTVPAV